jgi:hypothetical protein
MIGRAAAIAGGVAVVAAAAIYGGLKLIERPPESESGICLERALPFVEGATKNCYEPAEVAALADRPVIDEQGAEVTVSLTHPTDVEAGVMVARTCSEFRKEKGEGWYALSSKDMRREAFFERACGALATIERGRSAEVTFFEKRGLTDGDLKSLAEGPAFRIGPDFEISPGQASVTKTDKGWRLSSGAQSALIEEIAKADFNSDGREDILVLVTIAPDGGTASASEIGILDKSSAAGPVRFVAR